jgi:hypothetical protein
LQVKNLWGGDSAARRARWFAELSAALDEARALMKRLGADEGRPEVVELYARIEILRLEVETLRLGPRYALPPESGRDWINSLPWRRQGGDF